MQRDLAGSRIDPVAANLVAGGQPQGPFGIHFGRERSQRDQLAVTAVSSRLPPPRRQLAHCAGALLSTTSCHRSAPPHGLVVQAGCQRRL